MKKFLALLLALVMLLSLAACGGSEKPADAGTTPKTNNETPNTDPTEAETLPQVSDSDFFGPIYDEWSEMTDEELYELAKKEVAEYGPINIYATSSKMLKEEGPWLELYP